MADEPADASHQRGLSAASKVDLDSVATARDFGRALTDARERAGLSVREVAQIAQLPPSTVGGYFSGTHLPGLQPPHLVRSMLRACGVVDPDELDRWERAWLRVRRNRRMGSEHGQTSKINNRSTDVSGNGPSETTAGVEIAPPLFRLNQLSALRGRNDLLDLLTAELPTAGRRNEGGVHVLYGGGGMGKSTLALVLAARADRLGVQTWWISAAGDQGVSAGMATLAVELGVTHDELLRGRLPDLIWHRLAELEQPWLLVVDNADNPAGDLASPGGEVLDGRGWLRRLDATRGMILVTSRDSTAWSPSRTASAKYEHPVPWVRTHHLEVLSERDAAAVLQDAAGPRAGTTAEAAALARRLGGLPLALSLAGRFLARAIQTPRDPNEAARVRTYRAYEQALAARWNRIEDRFDRRLVRAGPPPDEHRQPPSSSQPEEPR